MKIKLFIALTVAALSLTVSAADIAAQSKAHVRKPRAQTARILIDRMGYSRTSIDLRRGVPARLTFVRQTDETCATEIVIPEYGINQSLPLNEPTVVRFIPNRSGTFNFTCGMNMMRGRLIVR